MDGKYTTAVVARMRAIDVCDIEVGLVTSGASVVKDKIGWGDVDRAVGDIAPTLSFISRCGRLEEGKV